MVQKASGFLQNTWLFADEIQQSQCGASGFAAALLPTDFGYLWDIQQAREHSLANTIFSSNRYDFFGLNRLDGRWHLKRPGAERELLDAGGMSGQSFDTAHQVFGVEFDFFAFNGLNSAL